MNNDLLTAALHLSAAQKETRQIRKNNLVWIAYQWRQKARGDQADRVANALLKGTTPNRALS